MYTKANIIRYFYEAYLVLTTTFPLFSHFLHEYFRDGWGLSREEAAQRGLPIPSEACHDTGT